MKDLIDSYAASDGEIRYLNAGRAIANGLEIQVDARFPGGLRATASYALQAIEDQNGVVLSNSPRNVFKALVSTELFGAVTAAARFRCESSRVTVYGTESTPYCLADLNLTTAPIRGFSFSLGLRNLFDRRYGTPGGAEHVQPTIEQDGRTFAARVSWTF
jgi:iron complex outermembrane receptor protein